MTSKKNAAHEEDVLDIERNEDESDRAETPDADLQDDDALNESGQSVEEDLKEESESEDARYMRLAADFQNFKRRVQKEKNDIYSYANEKIALDIIEVMDNFE